MGVLLHFSFYVAVVTLSQPGTLQAHPPPPPLLAILRSLLIPARAPPLTESLKHAAVGV